MNTEAIFSQIEGLVAELRRKNENEEKNIKLVNWVLLPIGGIEMLTCDCCYKTVKQQDMHIARTNGSMKVVCEKCWEEVEEK
jgi:hypothetical protein